MSREQLRNQLQRVSVRIFERESAEADDEVRLRAVFDERGFPNADATCSSRRKIKGIAAGGQGAQSIRDHAADFFGVDVAYDRDGCAIRSQQLARVGGEHVGIDAFDRFALA